MRTFKKISCILMAAVILLMMTACWDHIEINKLTIIAGIGLDVDEDEVYHATVEFVNPEAEGGESIKPMITEGDGSTLYSAIQNAMTATGGKPFANHCKVVIIGEKLAREGLGGVVEMILRSPDFRKTVNILIAKDEKAGEMLKKKTLRNDIVSYELDRMLTSGEKTVKNTVVTGMYQIHETLLTECPYYVIPALHAKNDEEILEIDGCAVFSGDKLEGFFDGEQAKLLNILVGNGRQLRLTITGGEIFPAPADVKIAASRIRLNPLLTGEELTMEAMITAEVTLEDSVLASLDPSGNETAQLLEKDIEVWLTSALTGLIDEMQKNGGADIFGFHLEYEDAYRKEWADLRRDWPSHFRDMGINMSVTVNISSAGLIGSYISGDRDSGVALP